MNGATPTLHRHPTGSSIAAILAAGTAVLALGIIQLASELNEAFKDWLQALGAAWIPHATHIGPYSGKETLTLLVWLGTWVVLHALMRHRNVSVRFWFGAFLAMLTLGLLLIWPPVWHLFE